MYSRRTFLGAAASAAAIWPSIGHARGPVLEIANGRICGVEVEGIHAFKGLPYGTAPQFRRFQPPLHSEPWSGVFDASDYGPMAPQPLTYRDPAFLASWANPQVEDEDCLRLNLWTPGLDSRRRPVMVWLHGGGFSAGSGSALGFDGHNLARRGDIVLVSVTHRLNAFGHLYLKELGSEVMADSGAVGMLDVVAALQWVRDNIEQFGGDPNNVTIFGQSGGAGKVMVLMAMPAARGLFHRAIVQSGSTGIGVRTPESATEDAVMLLKVMGLGPSQVEHLRAVPMRTIQEAMQALAAVEVGGNRPWGSFTRREWRPVLDGRSIPCHPFYPEAPAISADVPLLIGTTRDESRCHLGTAFPECFDLQADRLKPILARCMNRDPSDDIDHYRSNFPDAAPSELVFRIFTDWRWRYSAIWLAERKIAQGAAPAFMYRMDWATPIEGGRWRALHMVDVPFAFDNLERSASLVGSAPPFELASAISETFLAFARSGAPGHRILPEWRAYDNSLRQTMIFDDVCEVEKDPDSIARKFYEGRPRRAL